MRTEELILRAQAGSQEARAVLVEQNTGLIRAVAKRFFGRGVESDDLFQLGCLGFLKAVDGFDTEYGTQFSTYAVPKIAGEIRRFLRDDGAVKVSRSLKERACQIRTARQRLAAELLREPTLSELSEQLGLSPEEIAEAETAAGATESIQRPNGETGLTLEDVLPDARMEDFVERLALREAVAQLPERLRSVIALRYYHGLTQQKAANLLGVSQVQVSRLEKKALLELRKNL